MSNYIHTTEEYVIERLPDGDNWNYAVVNKQTNCKEYSCNTLPQAIGVCEQLNFMICNQTYKDLLRRMFEQRAMEEEPGDPDPAIDRRMN